MDKHGKPFEGVVAVDLHDEIIRSGKISMPVFSSFTREN
jgi:hypothetical protein